MQKDIYFLLEQRSEQLSRKKIKVMYEHLFVHIIDT